MRYIVTALSALLFSVVSGPASAFETTYKNVGMVYYKYQFGGSTRHMDDRVMGFRWGQVRFSSDPATWTVSSYMQRPAILEYRVNGAGLQYLSWNGLDVMEQKYVMNAAGVATAITVINWGHVAAAGAATVAVAAAASGGDSGDDSSSSGSGSGGSDDSKDASPDDTGGDNSGDDRNDDVNDDVNDDHNDDLNDDRNDDHSDDIGDSRLR